MLSSFPLPPLPDFIKKPEALSLTFQAVFDETYNYDEYASPCYSLILTIILLCVYFVIPRLISHRYHQFSCDFTYVKTPTNLRIVEKLRNITYSPPWWYNNHIGSVFALGHDPEVAYVRRIITHESCGSSFALDWYPSVPDMSATTKICIFVPGLGSKSSDKYIQKFTSYMWSQGFHCAVVGARGVSMPLTSANRLDDVMLTSFIIFPCLHCIDSLWHPAMTEDVEYVIESLPAHVAKYLVGFSAGTCSVRKVLVRLSNKQKLEIEKQSMVCNRPNANLDLNGSWSISAPVHAPSTCKKKKEGNQRITRRVTRSMSKQTASTPIQEAYDEHIPVFTMVDEVVDNPGVESNTNDPCAAAVSTIGTSVSAVGAMAQHRPAGVAGAMIVCVGGDDYVLSRGTLEGTDWSGLVYSLMMCKLLKNSFLESKEFLVDTYDRQHRAQAEGSCDESRINPASLPLYILKQIEDCHIISHFDQHVWRLFGFESEQHMHEEFSARDVSTISIPLLLVQPLDDPLHQCKHRANINVDACVGDNGCLVYAEPSHGNHFGFYEGDSILSAFSSGTCYQYPAKMASTFFDSLQEE